MYPAELYAATHTGTPGDLAFYREVCAGAEAVLEFGCGAGRVLAALVPIGSRLVGLDRDAGLLALAHARLDTEPGVTLIEADMRTVSLRERFDHVIIPHSAIYCLLSEADVAATLERAHAHLRPGGQLTLDAYAADDFHRTASPRALDPNDLVPITTVTVDGIRYHVAERSTWAREHQRIDVTYVYSPQGAHGFMDPHPGLDAPVQGMIQHRYLLRPQLRRLLGTAGFADVRIRGTFDGQPCRRGDELWIATARRPV